MDSLLLPKVSVIIVNYNYDAYLWAAVDSVLSQTYPHIEIVIVDDCSTDASSQTIDRICAEHKHIIAVKQTTNGGQSVASFGGLTASSGAYVLFLDADDQLLPEAVEAHVYTHLSSRFPVAFTTVDILNNVQGQDINMSHAGFSEYVESGRGQRPKAARPVEGALPGSWFAGRPPAVRPEQMHFVLPPYIDPWIWSPTSANCYRREAVALLLKSQELDQIRWGTDAYLIRPLSGLFGSILIDRPLVRYVIHTTNRFSRGAPLHGFLFFDTRSTADHIRMMARAGVVRLMSDASDYGFRYDNPRLFFEAMQRLSDCWPGPAAGEKPNHFFLQQLLAHRDALEKGFGRDIVAATIAQNTAPPEKKPTLRERIGFG